VRTTRSGGTIDSARNKTFSHTSSFHTTKQWIGRDYKIILRHSRDTSHALKQQKRTSIKTFAPKEQKNMNQLTTYFAKGMGKQSLREAIKAGGWKVLIDGNLTETMVRHGPGADLIGVDQFGNKYFQKLDTQVGRHR